ncbi:MAG TPA: hypothetical protein VG245_02325 [Candidatus Dormibacteraeota bacterium]|nr:hypothetical protein [Candidatus Dormibacteraeota bacterium]
MGLTLVGTAAGAIPARATGTHSDSCLATLVLSFDRPFGVVPTTASQRFGVHGYLSCPAAPSTSMVSVLATGNGAALAGSDCLDFLSIFGNVSFYLPWGRADTIFQAAGPAALQAWALTDASGGTGFNGLAVLAWTSSGEQLACAGGGTPTMTLTGSVTFGA